MSGKPGQSITSAIATVLAAVVVLALVQGNGWQIVKKYFSQRYATDKLAVMQFHGEWSLGEYRGCESFNLPEEDKNPVLACIGGTSPANADRVFKVAFFGATYESEQPKDKIHYWLCRRDGTDPGFSCSAKETEEPRKEQATKPEQPEQRDLSNSDIDNLRKRNQCEQRFYHKKIYEVDGMSIGPACKQNPNRTP